LNLSALKDQKGINREGGPEGQEVNENDFLQVINE
jgi:hypothetical protein